MSSFSENYTSAPSDVLPLRDIPGGYGLPFLGPINDRIDYYYNQGPDEFFRARIKKYNSTVYKVNGPPGPFNAKDPRVIVVLDAVSFPILFDTSKVEKRNVFTGTYMPSTHFTGGYRVCSYLDPSEPKHAILKGFFLSLLDRMHKQLIPTFRSTAAQLFADLEAELSDKGQANFNPISDKISFDFLFRLFAGKSSYDTPVGGGGNANLDKWLFFQLAPLVTLGLKFLPNCVEDLLLHTFPLPYFVVKSGYEKVHDAFDEAAGKLLDEAEKQGLSRDEASHNLMFLTGFNSYGGTKVLFPALLKYVGTGERTCTAALLLRSGPSLRRKPIATRDPKVFANPEEFVPDRFLGEGEKLIKYVYWSNGRETDNPTADNKQCPAKDMVVLLSRMMLVEFFIRYDTFSVAAGKLLLGSSVTFKSVTKAV
ncbi:UNVERIFIED_CONTAM: Allene oxide synthase 3 [Sesamum latifolium]|uniref:Allene oxide synthase 3 n=1 Tax=Sesamum latifolium TaxID=2727402 RepID=A0AAW2UYU8_9LAMI